MPAASLAVHFVRSFFAICIVTFPGLTSAGRGLRAGNVSAKEVEFALLSDLAKSYKRADGSSRLKSLEDALRDMYIALPKDAHGGLSHSVVRYALHRLFMQRNSWFVRGLDPSSDAQSGNPADVSLTLDSVPVLPSLLQGTLEHEHKGRGLTLRETAALAAAFEDLAHRDAHNRLNMVYDVLNLQTDAKLAPEESRLTVGTYMAIYLLGNNFSNWTAEEVRIKELAYFRTKRWRTMSRWVDSVRSEVGVSDTKSLSFQETERLVETLGERFGQFNDMECKGMKTALLEIEGRVPGRVRLSDFYNRSRYGVWGFKERIDYLRVLGALDESNASNPQVIVPNYVTSMPQCLKGSSIYSVCCRDECEDLLSSIEHEVAAPEADPMQITGIVVGLSSDTVKAPRALSETLLQRLQSVADHHGGLVPIHGRLFAQWMHHAFPRECPYPHKAGTTSPQTPDEWMKGSGHSDSQASEQEMLEHIRPDDICPVDSNCDDVLEESVPWTYTEELLTSSSFNMLHLPRAFINAMDAPILPNPIQGPVVALLGLFALYVSYATKLGGSTSLFSTSKKLDDAKCI